MSILKEWGDGGENRGTVSLKLNRDDCRRHVVMLGVQLLTLNNVLGVLEAVGAVDLDLVRHFLNVLHVTNIVIAVE